MRRLAGLTPRSTHGVAAALAAMAVGEHGAPISTTRTADRRSGPRTAALSATATETRSVEPLQRRKRAEAERLTRPATARRCLQSRPPEPFHPNLATWRRPLPLASGARAAMSSCSPTEVRGCSSPVLACRRETVIDFSRFRGLCAIGCRSSPRIADILGTQQSRA